MENKKKTYIGLKREQVELIDGFSEFHFCVLIRGDLPACFLNLANDCICKDFYDALVTFQENYLPHSCLNMIYSDNRVDELGAAPSEEVSGDA